LRASASVSFEVIVVDDQPRDDGSIGAATALFPGVRVAKTTDRHGFGAACNAGIAVARGRYIAILNNDVEVAPGWLDALVAAADAHPTVGILQAKILSLHDRTRFDYSGAAGGMIDWLGYPYALGRVFDDIEVDHGQYDEPCEIFWAVGSAMLITRACLDRVGGFDESFFMHMEEMDLAWRAQLAGFQVRSCPAAVVYHHNGYTLQPRSFRKAYLNHRNSLVILLKNLPLSHLLWHLPIRVGMELMTAIYGLVRRDWKHPVAALAGLLWLVGHLPTVLRRRFAARRTRIVPDRQVLSRMYPRSIVVEHFAFGRRPSFGAAPTPVLQAEPAIRIGHAAVGVP
jgi:GT2 family glycosyltransferase